MAYTYKEILDLFQEIKSSKTNGKLDENVQDGLEALDQETIANFVNTDFEPVSVKSNLPSHLSLISDISCKPDMISHISKTLTIKSNSYTPVLFKSGFFRKRHVITAEISQPGDKPELDSGMSSLSRQTDFLEELGTSTKPVDDTGRSNDNSKDDKDIEVLLEKQQEEQNLWIQLCANLDKNDSTVMPNSEQGSLEQWDNLTSSPGPEEPYIPGSSQSPWENSPSSDDYSSFDEHDDTRRE